MGYLTTHELEIIEGDSRGIIEELREYSDAASLALDEDGDTNESCKWYDHLQDMTEFSKRYPDHVFKLIGRGEENQDIWIEYYKNGKSQVCKAIIRFDEYDESKLS